MKTQVFPEWPTPYGSCVFFYRFDISNMQASKSLRFLRWYTLNAPALGLLFHMELQLLVEFLFFAVASEKPDELTENRHH
jgi:hypothetical protein